jgi:hypothetical protein
LKLAQALLFSWERSNEILQVCVLGVTFRTQRLRPITGRTHQSHVPASFDYRTLCTYPPCGRILAPPQIRFSPNFVV